MKFRAVIDDTASMREFMNIINSLSKLAKEGVMRLSRGIVYFIIFDEEERTRKLLVWCELPVNYYFKAYNLEGVNEEYNEIYLAFTTSMLAKSLATLKQNAKCLKIKLTNKQIPCLTLEIELNSNEGFTNRQVTHDIPVDVIARKHWNDYEQPKFQDFHVSIEMPHLKRIKNIVERMRSMSSSLIVNANKFGRLTLKIKTNMVTLSAHFPDLGVQSFVRHNMHDLGENEEESANDESTVTATVDIKKFLMFLTGMHINNYQTTCSIVHNSMVKLSLTQPDALSLQFYLTELSL